jgi:thioredoxin 1
MRNRSWTGVFAILLLTSFCVLSVSCGPGSEGNLAAQTARETATEGTVLVMNNLNLDFSKHLITFIELGADRCIPCKAMQPIMKEIAAEYKGKVQVVFYDVWKDPEPARKYGIQLIPTQVFIDSKGKEVFRHVGLFPKDEILKMFAEKRIR